MWDKLVKPVCFMYCQQDSKWSSNKCFLVSCWQPEWFRSIWQQRKWVEACRWRSKRIWLNTTLKERKTNSIKCTGTEVRHLQVAFTSDFGEDGPLSSLRTETLADDDIAFPQPMARVNPDMPFADLTEQCEIKTFSHVCFLPHHCSCCRQQLAVVQEALCTAGNPANKLSILQSQITDKLVLRKQAVSCQSGCVTSPPAKIVRQRLPTTGSLWMESPICPDETKRHLGWGRGWEGDSRSLSFIYCQPLQKLLCRVPVIGIIINPPAYATKLTVT